jgi:hypothetical protein
MTRVSARSHGDDGPLAPGPGDAEGSRLLESVARVRRFAIRRSVAAFSCHDRNDAPLVAYASGRNDALIPGVTG